MVTVLHIYETLPARMFIAYTKTFIINFWIRNDEEMHGNIRVNAATNISQSSFRNTAFTWENG